MPVADLGEGSKEPVPAPILGKKIFPYTRQKK